MDRATSDYLREQVNEEFRRFETRGAPPGGRAALPDIPTGRYIDDAFFALEQQHIWHKSWLFAAHADELPEAGSFVLWEKSGDAILLVRGRDGEIRAFYNTCMHRGGPVVREASGRANTFVCKYHCWAYDLDGALKRVPDEHEFPGLDKAKRGLRPIRCERFGNFVFVNRDPQARPLQDFLGVLVHELQDFEFDKLRLVHKYQYDLPVNWKICVDAFLEVYHLKHIHPETVDAAIDHRGASMALFAGGLSRMMVPTKTGEKQFSAQPAQHPLEEGPRHEMARSGSLSYTIFPNLVTPIGAVRFPLLLFWPVSRKRTLFEVVWCTREENTDKDSEHWKSVIDTFNVILDEDLENLPWIQRSIDSGALAGIPLSYQERRIYHFQQYIDRVIGAENIPAPLRVRQSLAGLEEDGRGQAL